MGGWNTADGRVLEAIASILERIAEAEERRNELIIAEGVERRASWAKSEKAQRELAERLLSQPEPKGD